MTTEQGDLLRCLRCGKEWHQGGQNPPKNCRWCISPLWNSKPSRPATVQRIPKTLENSSPVDFFQGVRVLHKNGRYGTVISPKTGIESTTLVTLIIDNRSIMTKVPIEKLKIVQAVD